MPINESSFSATTALPFSIPSSSSLVLDLLIACSGLYLLKRALLPSSSQPAPYPPGPKPKPIVGNIADFPKPGEQEWVHWAKHRELYGPISHVSAMGAHVIIISSLPLAQRMLEQAVFSSRPVLPFAGQLCGYENALAMLPYGDRFKVLRRYLHQYMGTRSAMANHHGLQEAETHRFLVRLLDAVRDKPPAEVGARLADEIRVATGSIILKLSHGYTTAKDRPDPLVQLADDALGEFSLAAQAGQWMVDIMPFLRHLPDWLPGTSFKRIAARWRKNLDTIVDLPHAFTKSQVASGTHAPSFTAAFLEDGSALKSAEAEDTLKWAAFAIYGGGADTTVSALATFFLCMARNPDVQARAQAEVDRVTGGGERLPHFADRDALPYVDALVKEVLRWAPVVPLCLPHAASGDTVFDGYFIPKGAIILPNIWLFAHDPATYKDPFTFNPERFLGPEPEFDPHAISFGFGRRICPGKELADASLFITIATTLAVLNIGKPRGPDGQEVEPEVKYCSGIISHPKPFACTITPRSERAAALLRQAAYADDHGHPEKSDADALAGLTWLGQDN